MLTENLLMAEKLVVNMLSMLELVTVVIAVIELE